MLIVNKLFFFNIIPRIKWATIFSSVGGEMLFQAFQIRSTITRKSNQFGTHSYFYINYLVWIQDYNRIQLNRIRVINDSHENSELLAYFMNFIFT